MINRAFPEANNRPAGLWGGLGTADAFAEPLNKIKNGVGGDSVKRRPLKPGLTEPGLTGGVKNCGISGKGLHTSKGCPAPAIFHLRMNPCILLPLLLSFPSRSRGGFCHSRLMLPEEFISIPPSRVPTKNPRSKVKGMKSEAACGRIMNVKDAVSGKTLFFQMQRLGQRYLRGEVHKKLQSK